MSIAHSKNKDPYEQFCLDIVKSKPQWIIITSSLEKGHITYLFSDLCLSKTLLNSNFTLEKQFSTTNNNAIYRYQIYKNQH